MRQQSTRIVTLAIATCILTMASSSKAQVGFERKVLLQQDLAIPGYQAILAEASIAVGGREGKHWHPGTLIGRMLEGELTLELEGQPTKILKPGDPVLIEPRQVHEGINKGSVPVKALVTLIVEKGKPSSSPAK